jgi:hypothetical protein
MYILALIDTSTLQTIEQWADCEVLFQYKPASYLITKTSYDDYNVDQDFYIIVLKYNNESDYTYVTGLLKLNNINAYYKEFPDLSECLYGFGSIDPIDYDFASSLLVDDLVDGIYLLGGKNTKIPMYFCDNIIERCNGDMLELKKKHPSVYREVIRDNRLALKFLYTTKTSHKNKHIKRVYAIENVIKENLKSAFYYCKLTNYIDDSFYQVISQATERPDMIWEAQRIYEEIYGRKPI